MAVIPAEEQLLPTPEQIELADYLMGSYLSELDVLASKVKRETSETFSFDEYKALSAAGYDFAGPDLDRDALNRVLLFAVDALRDSDTIREKAVQLLDAVTGVLHDMDEPGRDPARWAAYTARIRAYHRDHARKHRRDG